jgi:electron transfer flavoprotein alpha/beta subunit
LISVDIGRQTGLERDRTERDVDRDDELTNCHLPAVIAIADARFRRTDRRCSAHLGAGADPLQKKGSNDVL